VLNWGHGNSFDTFLTFSWASRTVSFIFLGHFCFCLISLRLNWKICMPRIMQSMGKVDGKGQPKTKRLLLSLPSEQRNRTPFPGRIFLFPCLCFYWTQQAAIETIEDHFIYFILLAFALLCFDWVCFVCWLQPLFLAVIEQRGAMFGA